MRWQMLMLISRDVLRLCGGAEQRIGPFGPRTRPLDDYCSGLLLPGERKSVEPMAAQATPERVSAKHQSLPHFVGQAGWSKAKVAGQNARAGAAGAGAMRRHRGLDHRRQRHPQEGGAFGGRGAAILRPPGQAG